MSSKREIEGHLKRFGANLRRERLGRKITQMALAESAGRNVRTVPKIEAGETNILITTATRLRKAVGCPWERLID